MGDEQKDKKNELSDAFKGFGESLKKDAKSRFKAWAWGAVSDGLDMLTGNAKKSISSYIFKGEPVPRTGGNGGRRFASDTGRYRDYSDYSKSTTPKDRDAIGNRSAIDIALVKARDSDEADEIIKQVYAKIDAVGWCRIADLYGYPAPENRIQPSVTDWKWGWSDKDKGGFGSRPITSGDFVGMYMITCPTPHVVIT